jgi:excisionase family DNA binding protein
MRPPLLYRIEEAAEELGLSRSRFCELLADEEIESVKIGRSRRIPHAALVAYVDRLSSESARSGDAA